MLPPAMLVTSALHISGHRRRQINAIEHRGKLERRCFSPDIGSSIIHCNVVVLKNRDFGINRIIATNQPSNIRG